jgi:hypothetical protein
MLLLSSIYPTKISFMLELIAWLILALVHLMPALAFFIPSLLTKLYRLEPGNALFLLMHHRAALFLAILVICVWSAFDVTPRRLASVAVAISMVSFLALYWLQGSPAALRQIAIVDLIGLPALAYVMWRAFSAA